MKREERGKNDNAVAKPHVPIGKDVPTCKRHAHNDVEEGHHDAPRKRIREDVMPRSRAERVACDDTDGNECKEAKDPWHKAFHKSVGYESRPEKIHDRVYRDPPPKKGFKVDPHALIMNDIPYFVLSCVDSLKISVGVQKAT